MHIYKKLFPIAGLIAISVFLMFSFDRDTVIYGDLRLDSFKSEKHLEIIWLNEHIYAVKDKLSRATSLYHLNTTDNPTTADIPDQIIDLDQYDPEDYADMYILQTTFALGSSSGYPLLISDVDKDSLIELAGLWYNDYSIPFSVAAIYEQTSIGTFERKRLFLDDSLNITQPIGTGITDLDNDSLPEINVTAFELYDSFNGIISLEADSLHTVPDSLNFMTDSLNGYSGSLQIVDLDKDGLKECIGFDPSRGLLIAEYDTALNKYKDVFLYDPPGSIYNFGIGDGDLDGKTDFICGSIFGDVYIFENTADNEYSLVWSDKLPFSNANISAATNDIDQNGKPEFYIGSDGYYQNYAGTALYWYESTGDNQYERKRQILIAGTGFSSENGLHPHDMDGDGVEELVFDFAIPNRMFILKWNSGAYFDMYYYNHVSDLRELNAVTIYKPNVHTNPDIIFSTYYFPELPVYQSHYYKFNPAVAIYTPPAIIPGQIELYQNYPNPFNPITTIAFTLPQPATVQLDIFDLNGRLVITIADGSFGVGRHQATWDGSTADGQPVASGVYFCRLSATAPSTGSGAVYTQTRKMLLMR